MIRMFLKLIFLMVFNFTLINAKILVMTHAFNKPEYINWQYRTFQKFLKDDYEFIVFDDAANLACSLEIQAICNDLGLRCFKVPQKIHKDSYLPRDKKHFAGPSAECADTIQYMLDTIGFDHPGIVVLVDSDMFLIRDICIKEVMKNYEILAHNQSRIGLTHTINYFLPNLIFFDMNQLPDKKTLNFNLGTIDNVMVDTGGFTYFYLTAHPDLKWLKINLNYSRELDENFFLENPHLSELFEAHSNFLQLATDPKFDYEFYFDYTFLHFRAGSNWYKMNDHWLKEKTKRLENALEEILNN